MPTTETIEKQNECKERVRNSRGIDWEAVASRLRAVREKVPGNATTADKRAHCCGLQEWARILWPDENKSHTKISQLERGKQTPDLDTLLRYAAAGGVSLEWLLYGETEKKEEKPTTLRDFCRVIADMWNGLGISIEIPPHIRDLDGKNDGETEYLTIKFPLCHYYYLSDKSEDLSIYYYKSGWIAKKALENISNAQRSEKVFFDALVSARRNDPDLNLDFVETILNSSKRFDSALHDILQLVPDVPIRPDLEF